MKKKVDCNVKEVEQFILHVLKTPVSESDGHGSPIGLAELERILEEEFEFSTEELCEALNNLSSRMDIKVYMKAEYRGEGEGHACTVDAIFLGPGSAS